MKREYSILVPLYTCAAAPEYMVKDSADAGKYLSKIRYRNQNDEYEFEFFV